MQVKYVLALTAVTAHFFNELLSQGDFPPHAAFQAGFLQILTPFAQLISLFSICTQGYVPSILLTDSQQMTLCEVNGLQDLLRKKCYSETPFSRFGPL